MKGRRKKRKRRGKKGKGKGRKGALNPSAKAKLAPATLALS